MSDLRERVARAIYEKPPIDWKGDLVPWEQVLPEIRNSFYGYADAAIAIALKEAVRRAEDEKFSSNILTDIGKAHNQACDQIAAAIRAMIRKPD